uniref:Uncharacterized protein n=1 Tax=Zea mays TaxID=4577 RepID=A0A804NXD2_MAIZE
MVGWSRGTCAHGAGRGVEGGACCSPEGGGGHGEERSRAPCCWRGESREEDGACCCAREAGEEGAMGSCCVARTWTSPRSIQEAPARRGERLPAAAALQEEEQGGRLTCNRGGAASGTGSLSSAMGKGRPRHGWKWSCHGEEEGGVGEMADGG